MNIFCVAVTVAIANSIDQTLKTDLYVTIPKNLVANPKKRNEKKTMNKKKKLTQHHFEQTTIFAVR